MGWDTWIDRNSSLYDTPLVEMMSGALCIHRVLRREWIVDFNTIPNIVEASLPNDINVAL